MLSLERSQSKPSCHSYKRGGVCFPTTMTISRRLVFCHQRKIHQGTSSWECKTDTSNKIRDLLVRTVSTVGIEIRTGIKGQLCQVPKTSRLHSNSWWLKISIRVSGQVLAYSKDKSKNRFIAILSLTIVGFQRSKYRRAQLSRLTKRSLTTYRWWIRNQFSKERKSWKSLKIYRHCWNDLSNEKNYKNHTATF
jgi:hypothetical protein